MKKGKRLISLLLTICMVLGMFPMAMASEQETVFSDVHTSDWFCEPVQYVWENGMMSGTGDGRFSPDAATTRGMIVTILHRMEGKPSGQGEAFLDVHAEQYYAPAVAWASGEGIVSGYGNGNFGPEDPITREQLAAILYRYARYAGRDTAASGDLSVFTDAGSVSGFAVDALRWAVGTGLISGMGYGRLAPQGSATRAQVAAMLMRFCDEDAEPEVQMPDHAGTPIPPSSGTEEAMEIRISNAEFNAETQCIMTKSASYTLTGTVTGAPVSVSIVVKSYDGESHEVRASGSRTWEAKLDLEIGTNTITISARDKAGNTAQKEIRIDRLNDELHYAEHVKFADQEDLEILEDGMVSCRLEENDPNTTEDDQIIVLAKEELLLLEQIADGLLLPGDVYVIPESTSFRTGFTAVYQEHRAPVGTEAYPLEQYPDSEYEEILFTPASLPDLFEEDISLDFSDGIDRENPVDYAMLMDGTVLLPTVSQENSASMLASDIIDIYPSKGWQPQELAKHAFPSLEVKMDENNHLSVLLNWDDITIYDKDGIVNDGAVSTGTLKLAGDVGLYDLHFEGGMEWHFKLTDMLPQQVKCKLDYEYGGSVTLKGDATADTEGLIKKANQGFDNKASFWGLEVAGVSTLKSKWVFGVIGVNLSTKVPTVYRTIKSVADRSKLDPTLMLILFVDMDGNITVEGNVTFGYKDHVTSGFNLQKDGYTGRYGSQNDNWGDKHYRLPFSRSLDIYNHSEGGFELKFGGKVEARMDIGMGAGFGVMFGGICPGLAEAQPFYRAKGLAEGEIQLLPELAVDGYAGIYNGIGTKGSASVKLALKSKWGDPGFDISKNFEDMIWEKTLNTGGLDGTVYAADDDGDNSNNPTLPEAKVTLTNKDTEEQRTAKADKNGKYHIGSIPDGVYKLRIEKDGYAPYINEHLEFTHKLTQDVYLNKVAEEDGICKLTGKITIADEDTDMTNNLPLEAAKVEVERITLLQPYDASAKTNLYGNYVIERLPKGHYHITISKEGYLTAKAKVSIADNIDNFYNATIEAIPIEMSGKGNAAGFVYDVLNGKAVPGLDLTIRAGINITDGDIITETKTDSKGAYQLNNLNAGHYTVAIKDNRTLQNEDQRYLDGVFVIKVLGDKTINNQNGHVTNGIESDQLRIVLRWGQSPRDLDSHLVGHDEDNSGFHIYYSNKNHSNAGSQAKLDHDITTSYGPETTTIYKPNSGKYVFSIHDFTNRHSSNSEKMGASGAYIEVYLGTSDVAAYVFNVPNEPGTVWDVFSYEGDTGTITPINKMGYCEAARDVGAEYLADVANLASLMADTAEEETKE